MQGPELAVGCTLQVPLHLLSPLAPERFPKQQPLQTEPSALGSPFPPSTFPGEGQDAAPGMRWIWQGHDQETANPCSGWQGAHRAELCLDEMLTPVLAGCRVETGCQNHVPGM